MSKPEKGFQKFRMHGCEFHQWAEEGRGWQVEVLRIKTNKDGEESFTSEGVYDTLGIAIRKARKRPLADEPAELPPVNFEDNEDEAEAEVAEESENTEEPAVL